MSVNWGNKLFDFYDADFMGHGVDPDTGSFDATVNPFEEPSQLAIMNNDAGIGTAVPTMSTPGQSGSPSLMQILGSLGTYARDVGTAVGSVRRDITGAGRAYNTAYNQAANPTPQNKLAQWWAYSSMTDKLTVGIGIAGLYYIAKKA